MMRVLLVLLIAILASPAQVRASHQVQLICNLYSPAGQTVECSGGGWPYTVGAGQTLCATDFILVNKFPYDPPAYGTNLRTMYFMTWGISVPAHNPHLPLRTPMRYGPGTVMRAWIANGMSEDQYVYGILLGYLSPNGCD